MTYKAIICITDSREMVIPHDAGCWSRPVSPLLGGLFCLLTNWMLVLAFPAAAETHNAGIEWQLIRGSPVEDLTGVAWRNGRFVAVGSHGTILHSRDGDRWEKITHLPASEIGEAGVAWNGKRYVRSSWRLGIIHSTDGTSWEKASGDWEGWVDFKDVAWGNGRFVAIGWWWEVRRYGGGIAYSDDGVRWQTQDACCMFQGVAWGNGRFVAVGLGGTIGYSDDGVLWEKATDSGDGRFNGTHLGDVAWGSDRFVAAGTAGYAQFPFVLHSRDGHDWIGAWADELHGVLPGRILWRDGHFRVVSWDGVFVFVSVHGIEWKEADNDSEAADLTSDDVAWSGERFVRIRGGTIIRSYDGDRWERVLDTGSKRSVEFRDVTWGGGRFVAVGSGGTIVYSTDGDRWKEADSPTSNSLDAVTWGAGQFVAVGDNGSILVSPKRNDRTEK